MAGGKQNKSGVVMVSLMTELRSHGNFSQRFQYCFDQKKYKKKNRIHKTFSCSKYGDEGAFLKACLCHFDYQTLDPSTFPPSKFLEIFRKNFIETPFGIDYMYKI